MKVFKFQQFEILQSKAVFRVGTDGVLLGALADVSKAKQLLEVGPGTGLISLMLSQRNKELMTTAVEINPDAVELCQQNFENAAFKDRLKVIHQDYKDFSSSQLFDMVVCNPPYFEENHSTKDKVARQKIELSFESLIETTSKIISNAGLFSVIIPANDRLPFEEICNQHQFYLNRNINIYGIVNGALKRNILEFSKLKKNIIEENFIIEDKPRQYSHQYLELTRDFHRFKGE